MITASADVERTSGPVVLGEPIEGVADAIDEMALLFAAGAREAAAGLAAHQDLSQRRAAAAGAVDLGRRACKEGDEAVENAQTELGNLASTRSSRLMPSTVKTGLAGGAVGLGLAAVGGALGMSALVWLGMAATAAAIGYSIVQRGAAQKAYQSDVDAAENAYAHVSGRRDSDKAALDKARASMTELDEALAEFSAQRTITAVGRVYYPLRKVDMAGYQLLLDAVGSTSANEFQIPDLATSPDVIASVAEIVERTAQMPVMLSPSQSEDASIDTLHGEELELKGALADFAAMVRSIPVHRHKLPMVPSDSRLARIVETAETHAAPVPLRGAVLVSDAAERSMHAIDELSAVADRLRKVGGQADEVLRETHRKLEENLTAYEHSRDHALDILHGEFVDAMQRSNLLSVTCYCPKCNRIPNYLYEKLGVPLDEAHLADQRELLVRLNSDDEIARRIADNSALITDLNRVYGGWHMLAAAVAETGVSPDESAKGDVDLSDWQANLSRQRAMQNQCNVVLEEYRAILRAILTGHPRPLLELARAARLYLDPVHGTWTCAVCETSFADPAIVDMGRLLKVKDELMMPIWNHLWTEKDDFRKSEMFRTNEGLQLMGEKESEKLMSIGESYKADMRPVRENIIRYAADADNKQVQLIDTIDGLVDMGLMTAEKAAAVRGRLSSLMQGSISDTKRAAEAKELLLALEPQAQLSRRASADDPINMLLTPRSLFVESEVEAILSLQPPVDIDVADPLQLTGDESAAPGAAAQLGSD